MAFEICCDVRRAVATPDGQVGQGLDSGVIVESGGALE